MNKTPVFPLKGELLIGNLSNGQIDNERCEFEKQQCFRIRVKKETHDIKIIIDENKYKIILVYSPQFLSAVPISISDPVLLCNLHCLIVMDKI